MPFDQFIDADTADTVEPQLVGHMADDARVDFITEPSFPFSDPPPYYGGYRKPMNDMAP